MRKIINIRKALVHRGRPKTEKQIEANRRSGLYVTTFKNPMKNPEIAKKNAEARRGRKNPQTTLRNLMNNPMKNPEIAKKHSLKQKGRKYPLSSIQKLGKRPSAQAMETSRMRLLTNNPMKNPEIAKKQKAKELETRRLNKLRQKSEKIKNNPNVRRTWFMTNVPVTKELCASIISDYNNFISLDKLSKKYHLDRRTIRQILTKNNISIRDCGDKSYKLGYNFHKHKIEKEVKNDTI